MREAAQYIHRTVCVGWVLFVQTTLASDLQVSTNTALNQKQVAMAALAGGTNVVFAWADDAAGADDIYFRVYNRLSATFGAVARANSQTNGHQSHPAVAAWSNGFVIAFSSQQIDGDVYGVAFRRFLANGSAVDAQDVPANATASGSQSHPCVFPLTNGGFCILFAGYNGADQDVYCRSFSAGGAAGPAETSFNRMGAGAPGAGDQGSLAVAALTGGTHVAVYEDRAGARVYATRFTPVGTPAFWPAWGTNVFALDVSPLPSGEFAAPSVAAAGNGRFVVACDAETNGVAENRKVMAKLFTNSGASGSAFTIGAHTQRWERARLAALASGSFQAAWQVVGDGPDAVSNRLSLFTARFTSNGVLSSIPHRLHGYDTNDQDTVALAAIPGGGWFGGWQSYGQDGSQYGAYGSGFPAAGFTQPDFFLMAQTGATLQARFDGEPYELYAIEQSTNLATWSYLATTGDVSGIVSLLVAPGAAPSVHFRAWGSP